MEKIIVKVELSKKEVMDIMNCCENPDASKAKRFAKAIVTDIINRYCTVEYFNNDDIQATLDEC